MKNWKNIHAFGLEVPGVHSSNLAHGLNPYERYAFVWQPFDNIYLTCSKAFRFIWKTSTFCDNGG